MELSYPIRLQGKLFRREPSGQREPIRFIQRRDLGFTFDLVDAAGEPTLAKGRDSSGANGGQGVLVSRLVGVRPGFLLKSCPRCARERPLESFGLRLIEGELRDQSYCSDCR